MIKYFKSSYPRGGVNLITPEGVKVSIVYTNKEDGTYIRKVENEDPILLEQFRVAIEGVEAPRPAAPLSPVKIMTLFPLDKIISIRSSTDPGVGAILQILDDPRLLEVDRNQPFFTQAVSYISSLFPLTTEETQRILTGV